jgi:hypothetical protein
MNRNLEAILGVALVALLGGGCGKGKGGDTSGPPKPMRIAKLNLSIAVPADSKVHDDSDDVSITNDAFGEVILSIEKAVPPVDDLKAMGVPSRNRKVETLPDGVLATYDFAGTIDPTYSVETYRTMGGRVIHCRSNVTDRNWQAGAAAACKSIAL